tara:strand:+ start:840 stop:1022 length:183 start_codon:yes stop_codon:yes gene_type:complete
LTTVVIAIMMEKKKKEKGGGEESIITQIQTQKRSFKEEINKLSYEVRQGWLAQSHNLLFL